MKNSITKAMIGAMMALMLLACSDGVSTTNTSSNTTTSSASSPSSEVKTEAKCRVVLKGDSITYQSDLNISNFLPDTCVVVNEGVHASVLADVVTSSMVFSKYTVYTYSYGVNECLGSRVSVADFKNTLKSLAEQAMGYKIVLEAPWKVTHSTCTNIEEYRQAVVDTGREYNIPVTLENNQDNVGDDIHITDEHSLNRAKLLAAEVIKLVNKPS